MPQKADVHVSTAERPVWSKNQTRMFLLWGKCAVFANSDASNQNLSAKNCGFQIQNLAQLSMKTEFKQPDASLSACPATA